MIKPVHHVSGSILLVHFSGTPCILYNYIHLYLFLYALYIIPGYICTASLACEPHAKQRQQIRQNQQLRNTRKANTKKHKDENPRQKLFASAKAHKTWWPILCTEKILLVCLFHLKKIGLKLFFWMKIPVMQTFCVKIFCFFGNHNKSSASGPITDDPTNQFLDHLLN